MSDLRHRASDLEVLFHQCFTLEFNTHLVVVLTNQFTSRQIIKILLIKFFIVRIFF